VNPTSFPSVARPLPSQLPILLVSRRPELVGFHPPHTPTLRVTQSLPLSLPKLRRWAANAQALLTALFCLLIPGALQGERMAPPRQLSDLELPNQARATSPACPARGSNEGSAVAKAAEAAPALQLRLPSSGTAFSLCPLRQKSVTRGAGRPIRGKRGRPPRTA
jgi:hypothetical protein